jgi:hypothetical protein
MLGLGYVRSAVKAAIGYSQKFGEWSRQEEQWLKSFSEQYGRYPTDDEVSVHLDFRDSRYERSDPSDHGGTRFSQTVLADIMLVHQESGDD